MKLFLLIFVLTVSSQLFAQETKISGTITDAETGQPISGASIHVEGKLIGTVTDDNGNYFLAVNKLKLPFSILISSVSHETKEVKVSRNNETISASLSKKTAILNEVVTAASRVRESILRSPVSIEKMTLKTYN